MRVVSDLGSVAWRRVLLSLAVALALFGLASSASGQVPSSYKVRAGFLYNFAKFVTWPPGSLNSGELKVCVSGSDPTVAEIEAISGKRVGAQVITVRRVEEPPAAGTCHILFISAFTENADRWLERADTGVLTVSEEGSDDTASGIIHLLVVDNKIRFEVDRGGAERAGLEVSSQLLGLALKVKN